MVPTFPSSILNCLPWSTAMSDMLLLECIIFYSIILFFRSDNLIYCLGHLFSIFFCSGLLLVLNDLELFTGFLWLTEVVVILVCILIILSTNTTLTYKAKSILMYKFLVPVLWVLTLLQYPVISHLPEYILPMFMQYAFFWSEFYESLGTRSLHDFVSLFISFNMFNSTEFVIVGFFLLVGSLICVNLFQSLKQEKAISYASFFDIYKYFKNVSKILFMRKQNLNQQNRQSSATKTVKKNKKY